MKTYYKKVKYFFYNFRQGIKNIIEWFPIIWKDRDWNNVYLYALINFKLNKMANDFEKNGYVENIEKRVQELRDAAIFAKELETENYNDRIFSIYYTINPFDPDRYIKNPSADFPNKEYFKALFEQSTKKHNFYINALFDTMKNSYRWWY